MLEDGYFQVCSYIVLIELIVIVLHRICLRDIFCMSYSIIVLVVTVSGWTKKLCFCQPTRRAVPKVQLGYTSLLMVSKKP